MAFEYAVDSGALDLLRPMSEKQVASQQALRRDWPCEAVHPSHGVTLAP